MPAAAAITDTDANPTTTSVAARATGWNGSAWERLKSSGGQQQTLSRISDANGTGINVTGDADGQGVGNQLGVMSRAMVFNGSTWDRLRNAQQITLLASQARTIATSSSIQQNYNWRGIAIQLEVTAASGTGGLTVELNDGDYGAAYFLATTPVTAISHHIYIIYPGATGNTSDPGQVSGLVLPDRWQVKVLVGDASSYTYSLLARLLV
jgi:hypothetical protein